MAPGAEYDAAAAAQRRPGAERNDGTLDARELVRLATLAASSHNTQPWKFRIGPDRIDVLPDLARRCPVVDPDDAHLYKSLGCAVENLVHAAAAQGFAAVVRAQRPGNGIAVNLERTRALRATELFRAIPMRQCTKHEYAGQPLDAQDLARLEPAGRCEGVRTILLTARAQLDAVTEYVTQGNRAQLADRAFRDELVSWIRFNPGEALRAGDGLAGRTAGQPALPRWLARPLLGFVLTPASQAESDARNLRSSAGVAVFVALRNDPAAWVETGRAYERFALQATALGLRTAFVNQPVEVPSLRRQFEAWLGLTGEHALLVARFGRGPLAPYSLRRPVDDVLVPPGAA
jgi:hypothetical protein